MRLTIHMTGTRPMIQHNGRLADPINPHTRALKELTAKRKKTDKDLIDIMKTEARGGIYETADGFVGLPTQNVWRSVKDAATAFKRGRDIERALLAADEVEPVLVYGEKVTVDDFLADPNNILYRPVVVQRARTMRARPIVRGWSCSHSFELLTDVIDPRDLKPILERAGRLVGAGDWRPTYGTYTCEVEV